jgi:uncharacterized protein YndB with AHSA1/START domain
VVVREPFEDADAEGRVVDDGSFVRGKVDLPGVSPSLALKAFTDPVLVSRWWGGELTAELIPGGRYQVEFHQLGRILVGAVIEYQPPTLLHFSWVWAHEADDCGRSVTVRASRLPDGAHLEVEHGPYGDGAPDRTAAAEHREGWEYFLPRLSAIVLEEARTAKYDTSR